MTHVPPPKRRYRWGNSHASWCPQRGMDIWLRIILEGARNGTLLKDFTGSTARYDQDIIGWSNVIVGVIYLLLAYAIEKLKNFQLEEAPRYKEFFNLVGRKRGRGGNSFLPNSLFFPPRPSGLALCRAKRGNQSGFCSK